MCAFVPNLWRRGKKKTGTGIVIAAAAAAALVGSAAAWELRVEAPPALEAAARRVRALDVPPLADALSRAGLDLPPRVDIVLRAEDDPLALHTPRWFVGLASGTRDIVIFPARISSYPYDSLEAVVRHEIVHLALTARAGGGSLPRWFHEGAAVSVESGWNVTDRLRLLFATFSDPAVKDVARLFESPRQPHTTQAYLLAAALMDALRESHGAALPGRIAGRVAGGTPFTRAFELETGETPDQAAVRVWRSYRRWTSWGPAITSPSSTWVVILALAFVAFFARLWRSARLRRQWDEEDIDD